ncbi:O150 family O-antigen flippase, partial [Escherichia coli]|nr:O150 family O-antigen flippase [Escherichia coli]
FTNLIVSIFIGLLLTPLLVKSLGIEVYGVLPIALFLTFYMGVIAQALTASVNRFLIEDFIKGAYTEASVVFSTSFILILGYLSVISIGFIYPILHISDFFNIPPGYEHDAVLLFSCVIFSFVIAMISSSLSVSMYAKNRIDLMQYGNILRNITKVLIIIMFVYLSEINLTKIGISIVLSELFYLIYVIITWKVLTPQLSLQIGFFRKDKVKRLTSFSGWILFDQIGSILFLKTDLILVNSLSGSKANGEYSIATQFSDLLRSLAGLVAGSLGPMMVILYEEKKLEELTSLTITFVKFLSLTIAIPIIILCVYSKEILELWLGSGFVFLSPLICIVTLPLIINLGTLPILSINIAVKKIQVPALINFFLAIVGIIGSVVLFKTTTLGYYAVAISYVITLTIKNSIFIPWYATIILNKPRYLFFKTHLITIIFSSLFFIFIYILKSIMQITNLNLLFELILVGCFGLLSTFPFYSKEERRSFMLMLKRKV